MLEIGDAFLLEGGEDGIVQEGTTGEMLVECLARSLEDAGLSFRIGGAEPLLHDTRAGFLQLRPQLLGRFDGLVQQPFDIAGTLRTMHLGSHPREPPTVWTSGSIRLFWRICLSHEISDG